MKFLVSRMADLKLRLLERIVQPPDNSPAVDTLSHEKIQADKMILCQAVEDRICKRVDLASRPDLTTQQATDALHLLLKIVRRNGLPVRFSLAEFHLLQHGVPRDSGQEMIRSTPNRPTSVLLERPGLRHPGFL